ncbi:hypothetical protein HBB16_18625 [Pseudonocardia sp. MCCB 268]|nr:hypothetical protein [Pseudonocardia cytotoxica]
MRTAHFQLAAVGGADPRRVGDVAEMAADYPAPPGVREGPARDRPGPPGTGGVLRVPEHPRVGAGLETFAERLLREESVVVVPGDVPGSVRQGQLGAVRHRAAAAWSRPSSGSGTSCAGCELAAHRSRALRHPAEHHC